MSSFNYLDKTGLATLWGKIKALIPTKISEFENDSEYITDLEEKKIVSGSVVNFSDGMDVPVKDLVVGIEPVQSGSGDPSPTNVRPISGWDSVTVTRAGKNLFDKTNTNLQIADAYTNSTTGIISGTGRCVVFIPCKANTSYVASRLRISNNERFAICYAKEYPVVGTTVYDLVSATSSGTIGDSMSVTVNTGADAKYIVVWAYWDNETTALNNLQIEEGSTATAYETYEGQTYSTSLPSTAYGGSLNVTTGVLTVDRAIVDLGTLTWNYNSNYSLFYTNISDAMYYARIKGGACMCTALASAYDVTWSGWSNHPDKSLSVGNNYSTGSYNTTVKNTDYTDEATFKTAMSGVYLVYYLATPTTYQLTATEVSTLLGYNNLYADTGNISLTYYTDSHATTAWVNSKLSTKQNTTVIQNKTSSDTTITLSENTFYIFPEMTTLTITCPTTGLYSFRFTSGTTATTLSITGITMPDGFTVEANKTYEISVYEGYGVATSWAVESNE